MFPTITGLSQLQENFEADALQFLPELVLCTGIVLMLLCRLVKAFDRSHLGVLSAILLAVALLPASYQFINDAGWLGDSRAGPADFFSGMLVHDLFASLVRVLLLAATLVTVLVTLLTGIPDRDDSGDFHVLLLGGTLGMMLMASANHLMMAFIAIEMASLPSYAMAGFLKGKRKGSEAALKYVVFGAGASGVMLYGISLLAGTFGTGYLPNVASGIVARLADANGMDLLTFTGLALTFVGLGFKLSAVPFHFWCPDVFEGAAAEVAGFLSVASKTAAIALTIRVLQTMQLKTDSMIVVANAMFVVPSTIGVTVGIFGAITVTFGNLAAFNQTNIKRMLAYSTIAHAGYMLLGIGAMTESATSSILYYLIAYLLMNLGAFAVVAFVRNKTGSEELSAFRGLVWKSPVLAVTMSLFLFSLLGFPPLAGFAGKYQVFSAIYEAANSAREAGLYRLGTAFYVLLGIGALNTAISAYYYLRIVRAMILEDDPNPAVDCSICPSSSLLLTILAALLITAGVVWNPITRTTRIAAETFTSLKAKTPTTIRDAPQAPIGVLPGPGGKGPGGKGPGGKGKGPNPKKGPAT
jgi:NADH-quinone oxidoreductase subunit N